MMIHVRSAKTQAHSCRKVDSEQGVLEDYTYTRGAQLSDLGLDHRLGNDNLCMQSIHCYEPLEKLYYSVWT